MADRGAGRAARSSGWTSRSSIVVSRRRASGRSALILAGQVRVDGQVVSKAGAPVSAANAEVDARRARSSLRRPRRRQARARARRPSTSIRRRAAGARHRRLDRRLHRRAAAARRGAASSRSTSATDSSIGGCATDPRVVVREGVNARYLTPTDLPARGQPRHDRRRVHLAAAHPARRCRRLLDPAADDRRAGEAAVRGWTGRSGQARCSSPIPRLHDAVIARVTEAAAACGSRARRAHDAPHRSPGATGNQEFFLHLR